LQQEALLGLIHKWFNPLWYGYLYLSRQYDIGSFMDAVDRKIANMIAKIEEYKKAIKSQKQ
jgi:hypothetical protein